MRPAHAEPCRSCRRRTAGPADHDLRGRCLHERWRTGGVQERAAHGHARDRCAGTIDRPLLVYLFDPYCPWSYGYLPALTHLLDAVRDEADVEVVTIGLHDGTRIDQAPAPMRAVQRATGVGFGPGYRRALSEGEMQLRSRDAAAAVIGMTAADPGRVPDVLWAVHRAFFWAGRSLSDGATVAQTAAATRARRCRDRGLRRPRRARRRWPRRTSTWRATSARRGPTLLVSHGDRLFEFEGPGDQRPAPGRPVQERCWPGRRVWPWPDPTLHRSSRTPGTGRSTRCCAAAGGRPASWPTPATAREEFVRVLGRVLLTRRPRADARAPTRRPPARAARGRGRAAAAGGRSSRRRR